MSETLGISFLYAFDFGNRLYPNFGDNIVSVSNTAAGDFDKSNLTTESIRQAWRSANCADWLDIIIKAEIKSRVDTVALLGHNLSPTAIVKVEGNNSNIWIAPPVSVSIPYSKKNLVLCQNLGAEYQYYRIRILDPANPCGFVQVGRIIGGRALTLTKEEDITDEFSIETNDLADKIKTEGFFRVSNEKVKARSLKAKFSKLSTIQGEDDNYTGLRTMFDLMGTTKPFLTILDRADPSFLSIWGQLDKIPTDTFTVNRYVSFSFSVDEVF